jgi:hypothetical protein
MKVLFGLSIFLLIVILAAVASLVCWIVSDTMAERKIRKARERLHMDMSIGVISKSSGDNLNK